MANDFKTGDRVRWHWASGTTEGEIIARFDRRVQRTIKGSKITRNGSAKNPAYLIAQDDGDTVLKLGSELTKR